MPNNPLTVQSRNRRPSPVSRAAPSLALYVERERNPSRPFGEQTQMFCDLTDIGAARGVGVVVLSPGYVSRRSGWTYDTIRKVWSEVSYPNPGVVIRRSGTFHQASLAQVTRDLMWFQQQKRLHTLPLLCSNKWLLFQALKDVSRLQPLLPETARASTPEEIRSYVQKWRDVYVKPLNGAQGISIYRLWMDGDYIAAGWQRRLVTRQTERLSNQFRPDTVLQSARFRDANGFRQFCAQSMPKTCLIQKTVPLPRTGDGRPFDFRWLVQCHPHPEVVARVARVGQAGAITTNIHTGGKAVDATQLLTTLDGKRVDHSVGELDAAAMLVASTLRDKYGAYAEVGIDLALTQGGHVSFFEVNPTPGRRMLRSMRGNVRQLSLQYLVEYAKSAPGPVSL